MRISVFCLGYVGSVTAACLAQDGHDVIGERVPHFCKLIVDDIDDLLDHAGTIVAANGDAEFDNVPARLRDDQASVDLVRVGDGHGLNGRYDGIAW